MKTIERLIPIIVMLLIALLFFKLGLDYQKEKYVPCNDVYLDSKLICKDCQRILYGDTIKYINRKGKWRGGFIVD